MDKRHTRVLTYVNTTSWPTSMDSVRPSRTIEDLPPEVIGIIQEQLPLYDAIKLGLASRRLRMSTDPRLWEQVRCTIHVDKIKGIKFVAGADDDERWAFLKELEIQVPHLELCHYCRIFHPRSTSVAESVWRDISSDTSINWEADCNAKEVHFRRLGINWGFGFRDVYAVMMNRTISGQHGIPLDDLCISTDWFFAKAYKNLHNASRSPFRRFVSYAKLDTEAIIRKKSLLVHRIQRLWVPIHLQGTDVLIRYGPGDMAGDFKICMHHGPMSGEMINNLTIPLREGIKYVLAARLVPESIEDGPLPHIVKRCEDCPTEYSITFHVHDSNSLEIVLDVWQNLGDCHSPTAPGWLNCWGMLNPRLSDTPDETARNSWYQAKVGYVADATVFPTPGWKSEAAHSSSAPVLREFAQLQEQAKYAFSEHPHNVNLDVVQPPTLRNLRSSRSNYLQARYDVRLRREFPPFEHEFRIGDKSMLPPDQIKYTRTVYYGTRRAADPRGAP